ncbi:hypothetical protein [Flavobacterium agrisoli]|uniref:Uncharacterized protein n=1 Tax=Flavobacterium agrisoli TaxID=2793066 RepID=A0A934UI17_9FLAO|nr:hypothetical protein [Flavobacterium agrisoli]MBK0368357.1 hypothetical protein [Flavobacterium agrisoli]
MEKNSYNKSTQNQDLAEIAEQGYTVRNGHNPNKPNPFEKPITEVETDEIYPGTDLDEDSIDENGKEKVVNDEFDNPSDNFDNLFDENEEDSGIY